MVINVQAFNATGKDNRRIYDELDDFQSRQPIDVISANRPDLILDEPQKMEGPASRWKRWSQFNALMVLRYSATHKIEHNKVHRLDALDAYNQKLVKKIAVRGITVKGLAGSDGLPLPRRHRDFEQGSQPDARGSSSSQTQEAARSSGRLNARQGRQPHDLSDGIEAYQGFVVSDINANRDTISFTNGVVVDAGQLADRDVTEETSARIQIREAIHAHFDKERELFAQGIKVLSLFFIDEVAKYRDYDREDTLGDYARIFEEEYDAHRRGGTRRAGARRRHAAYQKYLDGIEARETHEGYFSIDKKSKRLVDGDVAQAWRREGVSPTTWRPTT